MPPHHPALACTGFRLANLPSRVTIWLLRKGPHWRVYVSLFRPNGISGSQDIIVTQRQIFKYRNHPKTTKGANLPVEDYGMFGMPDYRKDEVEEMLAAQVAVSI